MIKPIQINNILPTVMNLKLSLNIWINFESSEHFQILDVFRNLDDIETLFNSSLAFIKEYRQPRL